MEDLFTNRAPTEDQAEMLDEITRQMLNVSDCLYQLPPSRFRSLALTKLEECSMWAKKATVFTYGVDPADAEAGASDAIARLTGSGDASPE